MGMNFQRSLMRVIINNMAGSGEPQYNIYDIGFDKFLDRSNSEDSVITLPNSNESSPLSSTGFGGGLFNPVEETITPEAIRAGELPALIGHGKKLFTDTVAGFLMGIDTDKIYKWIIGDATNSADWAVTTAATLTIKGTITATAGAIGGWNITATALYALGSGTPSASPSNGIILTSGSSSVIDIYEGTAKRVSLGFLSSGVFGLKGYATDGSTVIFELSDTQQFLAGWNFTSTVLRTGTTDANSNVLIDSANSLLRLGPTTGDYITIDGDNKRIRSSDYVSGVAGTGFTLEPDLLEVANISARGIIRTAVFQKNVISSVGGSFAVVDSDKLDNDMTALDSSTLNIAGNTTFAVNDILRIKDGTDDEWLLVTNAGSAPTYTVTRDQAGVYSADNNPAWKNGATVVNYGASGEGLVYLTASDTNAPFLSVMTHAGSPWSTLTTRIRLGNLNGTAAFVADTFGIFIGDYSSGKYLTYDYFE